jgi:hypothetical protein
MNWRDTKLLVQLLHSDKMIRWLFRQLYSTRTCGGGNPSTSLKAGW